MTIPMQAAVNIGLVLVGLVLIWILKRMNDGPNQKKGKKK